MLRDLARRLKERGPFTKAERALLTALAAFTLVSAAVAAAHSLFPELFYGEPTFNAADQHTLTGAPLPALTETNEANETEQNRHEPLNINAADAEALQQLPGIGPVLAQRIVNRRNERGPFETLEDLSAVEGIGEKRIEQLREAAQVVPMESGSASE